MEGRSLVLGLVIGLIIGLLAATNPLVLPPKTVTITATSTTTKEVTKLLTTSLTFTTTRVATVMSAVTKVLTTTVTKTEVLTRTKVFTTTTTATVTKTMTPKEYYVLKEEVEKLKDENVKLMQQVKNLSIEVTKLSMIKGELSKKLEEYSILLSKVHNEVASRTGVYVLMHPEVLKMLCDWDNSVVKSALVSAVSSWSLLPKDAVTKIFDWVTSHIKYSLDSPLYVPPKSVKESGYWIDDYWRKASETIVDGHGDCEDQAILLAAMVYGYAVMAGKKLYPLLIWLQLKHYQHVMVVILYGEGKVALLDPTAKYLTGIDLLVWHQIEPKDAKQAVSDYLNALEEVGKPAKKVIAILDPIKGKVLKENAPIDILGLILEDYSKSITK